MFFQLEEGQQVFLNTAISLLGLETVQQRFSWLDQGSPLSMHMGMCLQQGFVSPEFSEYS